MRAGRRQLMMMSVLGTNWPGMKCLDWERTGWELAGKSSERFPGTGSIAPPQIITWLPAYTDLATPLPEMHAMAALDA
jgi:hypothetical protein